MGVSVDESYEKELFRFELENRTFFERKSLSRGSSYYDFNNFSSIIKELINEQKKDLVYIGYKSKVLIMDVVNTCRYKA